MRNVPRPPPYAPGSSRNRSPYTQEIVCHVPTCPDADINCHQLPERAQAHRTRYHICISGHLPRTHPTDDVPGHPLTHPPELGEQPTVRRVSSHRTVSATHKPLKACHPLPAHPAHRYSSATSHPQNPLEYGPPTSHSHCAGANPRRPDPNTTRVHFITLRPWVLHDSLTGERPTHAMIFARISDGASTERAWGRWHRCPPAYPALARADLRTRRSNEPDEATEYS